jgi:5-methylcytosine-specific restriction endonuclease McrA
VRGYDEAHRRLRVLAFQRDEWRCVDCGWRPTIVIECEAYGLDEPPPAVILDALRQAYNRGERHLQADHIVPIEVREDLRLDLDNYATRCSRCHNIKTARGL